MYSRREFAKTVAAGAGISILDLSALLADAKSDATVKGVKLGAITGALGQVKAPDGGTVIDEVIRLCLQTGAGHVELVNSLLEPAMGGACSFGRGPGAGPPPAPVQAPNTEPAPRAGTLKGRLGGFNPPCGNGGQVPTGWPAAVIVGYQQEREKLRDWRLHADMAPFGEVRKKFDAAGLDLYSYVMTIGDDFTDPEIDAVFKQMQALGVDKFCTNQTRVDMGPRFAPYCEKYKIKAAFHTHDQSMNPNEISSPASLAAVMSMSKWFYVNLDIGWFYRGGGDPFAYLKEHGDRITHLHIRDSAQDGGNADIGTGVIPVADILRYVRDKKLNIGCIIEQNGRAGAANDVDALKANIDWMKKALNS